MRFQLFVSRVGLFRRKEWRWRLLAGNHKIIATSGESYRNKADCKHGIDLLREAALTAAIEELPE